MAFKYSETNTVLLSKSNEVKVKAKTSLSHMSVILLIQIMIEVYVVRPSSCSGQDCKY